jgi:3-oxoacyl-[acyl-carrier protein] reductase
MLKKVLILGGSSDIGSLLVKKYLKKNYSVTAHFNKSKKKLNNLKCKKLFLCKVDFKKINQNNFNNSIKFFFGNYDIIINCVGYIDHKSFTNTNLESLINSIKINSLIPSLLIKSKIKNMLKKRWGRIVNCSSIGVKFGGGTETFNYSLSKHCSEFFPRDYKVWAKNNVLINNLRIGLTDTKIHKKLRRSKKIMNKRISLIPAKRMATIDEITNYIIELSSEKNSYMTGQTIAVSGGE